MIELTLDRARELLAEAVAERGEDYVYTGPDGSAAAESSMDCLYVHSRDVNGPLAEPVPGCIAGLVLHKAGVPLQVLERHEHSNAVTVLGKLAEDGVLEAERGTGTLLGVAQSAQDTGAPWGQAASSGLEALALFLPRVGR